MDMSDSEEDGGQSAAKKLKHASDDILLMEQNQWLLNQTREENDSLTCQLDAYKNEVDMIKYENKIAMEDKDKKINALQKVLQGMQQQIIDNQQKMKRFAEDKQRYEEERAINGSPVIQKETESEIPIVVVTPSEETKPSSPKAASSDDSSTEVSSPVSVTPVIASSTAKTKPQPVNQKEAKLIGLICTFLHVHPFGASTEYIGSYLHRLDITVRTSELEELLERLPSIIKQDYHGVGISIEKRWKFTALDVQYQ
jgi:hypothetical protein